MPSANVSVSTTHVDVIVETTELVVPPRGPRFGAVSASIGANVRTGRLQQLFEPGKSGGYMTC
jgi:hypothetical protein